jgi:hypothetical protein
MKRFLLIFCMLFFGMSRADAATREADLVWIENDGMRYEVFASSLAAGRWSEPVRVSDDHFNNLHPVVDRESNGRRWLLWTAVDEREYLIRYSTRQGGQWSEAAPIADELTAAMAPSVVIDQDNVVWAAWAGNQGDNDDIYFSRHRGDKWEEPARVHPANQVPDILPLLRLGADGAPALRWQTFRDGDYLLVESLWQGGKWSEAVAVGPDEEEATNEETTPENKKAEAEIEAPLVEVPDFVPDPSRAFMRVY